MKTPYKFITIISVCTVVICFSCHKTETAKPANVSAAVSTADLGRQIALNFYAAITGKMGGANINDGIKSPKNLSSVHGKMQTFDVNPLCGYTIDTAYNTTTTGHDTTFNDRGRFKFTYMCGVLGTGNSPDGYLVADSITNVQTGPLFENFNAVAQAYNVHALDNTFKLVSMGGQLSASTHFGVLNALGVATSYSDFSAQYALLGLTVNVSSGIADVVSGTSTFTMTQANVADPANPFNSPFNVYSGTITFLGNHMAHLSLQFNNTTTEYNINLLTGALSPA